MASWPYVAFKSCRSSTWSIFLIILKICRRLYASFSDEWLEEMLTLETLLLLVLKSIRFP